MTEPLPPHKNGHKESSASVKGHSKAIKDERKLLLRLQSGRKNREYVFPDVFSFPPNLFLELLVLEGEPEVLDVVLLHPAVAGDLDGDVDQVVQLVGHPVGLGRGRITVATD